MSSSSVVENKKNPSPVAAAMSISSNHDICTQILLRLPVKSLFNLVTVSKLWLSIISTPHFRRNHSSRQKSSRGMFFRINALHSVGVYRFLSLDQPPKVSTFIFYQPPGHFKSICASSCNGLLLLKSAKNPDFQSKYYHIYNPTTKEFKPLQIPLHICELVILCATLAFDPSESPHYKVVFMWPVQHVRSKIYQLEVYSSATGNCEAPVSNSFVANDFAYNGDCFYRGIFCNGAIHWLSMNASSMVYYNVHAECINQIPTPPLARNIHYFGQSQGHLHLVNSNDRHFYKCSVLDVFELKRDYSGWFLRYKVELASVTSALPQGDPRNDSGAYMSIFRDEEDDDSTMVILICDEWVEYNLKKKTTKRLFKYNQYMSFRFPSPCTFWFNTLQFTPTLACI